jgi:hypothetical protein
MSEQARKIRRHIPEWAEGLYYNAGIFSEALVYYDTRPYTSSAGAKTTAWFASLST